MLLNLTEHSPSERAVFKKPWYLCQERRREGDLFFTTSLHSSFGTTGLLRMLTSTSPPWWSREERRRLQQRLELEEEGRVSAVVNHPRQRGRKEREVCGVWCGGDVWICIVTYCVGVSFYTLPG